MKKTEKRLSKNTSLVKRGRREVKRKEGDENFLYTKIMDGDFQDSRNAELVRRLYRTFDEAKIKDEMIAVRLIIAKYISGELGIEDPANALFAYLTAHRNMALYWKLLYQFERNADQETIRDIKFSLQALEDVTELISVDELGQGEKPDEPGYQKGK